MVKGNKIDIQVLDKIFNSMVETIDTSKNDIFTISEQSRQSFEEMKLELGIVRTKLQDIIQENDMLEVQVKQARARLAEVSQNFRIYSEEQVHQAYNAANTFQIRQSVVQSEEKLLRGRRDDLERNMRGLLDTIEKADQLVNQVNVVLNYLSEDLKDVGPALKNAKMKEDFAIRVIEAQEEERKRISREVHDGPAQMLANVLLRTDLITRSYDEKGVERAIQELRDLKGMVRDTLHEVRRIIYDLRPMALDDLGIVPTLKKYLNSVQDYNEGTYIEFSSRGEDRRMPMNYETAIFRLVQESVNNAIKHGSAKEIRVNFEWLKENVNISIKDNGTGFDMALTKQNSFGIVGMKERIDLLDGTMDIQSEIGQGTRIMFIIPIKKGT
ncbi:histidine kinase [Kurthia sp. 3B1D]|uniref:Signal transduction histidine-protein kinase/phosphatase DegS n=1 Tax=Candidatus Kurthia intestinigallinarum TaxID=1562256 RepID=A0A433RTW8_9BACL|nr:sensor histidine kinase [Kurthia sp. 3B1D]RUS55584.1 histidine kinase [Kurthia sp. 3B1D]